MSSTSEVREVAFGRPWITDEERADLMFGVKILTHGPQAKHSTEFAASDRTPVRCGEFPALAAPLACHLAWYRTWRRVLVLQPHCGDNARRRVSGRDAGVYRLQS
jgi:hypothetical protein